ncbi:DUF5819 family protein [Streptomyces sp. NPDC057939]|uniref:DUF5819 family protein n=1 Tax=Streptomyces sp. NPDC057939 TaxID=3346284 RepID=UPI0036E8529F
MGIVVLAVAAVMVAAALHLAMLFLNNAPANALSRQHAALINRYVAPEFTQEWQLFAPNPQSSNVHVQARAQVLAPDADGRPGRFTETDWVDLTAIDERGILHNPFPSEAHQNELRLAWTNYIYSLDDKGLPTGEFGNLTQRLLLRLAVDRLEPRVDGTLRAVQLRSAVTPVGAPAWSDQRIDTGTQYLVQPWWAVKGEDLK